MMNQFSGEEKSEEERRDDLASIVGQEDAAQTPDGVLALVTPIVQISMAMGRHCTDGSATQWTHQLKAIWLAE